MNINELLGYELICKMSDGLKNHEEYCDEEFKVIIQEDKHNEYGYTATIKIKVDGKIEENNWEIPVVLDNFSFGNWNIIKKIKL